MLKKVLIFVLICFCMDSYAQKGYFQVQVGSQFLRDKNVGGFKFPKIGLGGYVMFNEEVGSSTNFDLSIMKGFNKRHGIQLGFGLFRFDSRLDFEVVTDICCGSDTLRIGVGNRNYSIYLGYRYTQEITSSWRCHLNAGPVFAFNGKSDFYFADQHFSVFFKPGVQYVTQYGLVLECNGVLLRSLDNLSLFETGTFIPFQWGVDLRVGKEF
jgi:hypothetical protein